MQLVERVLCTWLRSVIDTETAHQIYDSHSWDMIMKLALEFVVLTRLDLNELMSEHSKRCDFNALRLRFVTSQSYITHC